MSNYAEIIYPPDENNQYPQKLAEYLFNRFMKKYQTNDYTPKILDIEISFIINNRYSNFKHVSQIKFF